MKKVRSGVGFILAWLFFFGVFGEAYAGTWTHPVDRSSDSLTFTKIKFMAKNWAGEEKEGNPNQLLDQAHVPVIASINNQNDVLVVWNQITKVTCEVGFGIPKNCEHPQGRVVAAESLLGGASTLTQLSPLPNNEPKASSPISESVRMAGASINTSAVVAWLQYNPFGNLGVFLAERNEFGQWALPPSVFSQFSELNADSRSPEVAISPNGVQKVVAWSYEGAVNVAWKVGNGNWSVKSIPVTIPNADIDSSKFGSNLRVSVNDRGMIVLAWGEVKSNQMLQYLFKAIYDPNAGTWTIPTANDFFSYQPADLYPYATLVGLNINSTDDYVITFHQSVQPLDKKIHFHSVVNGVVVNSGAANDGINPIGSSYNGSAWVTKSKRVIDEEKNMLWVSESRLGFNPPLANIYVSSRVAGILDVPNVMAPVSDPNLGFAHRASFTFNPLGFFSREGFVAYWQSGDSSHRLMVSNYSNQVWNQAQAIMLGSSNYPDFGYDPAVDMNATNKGILAWGQVFMIPGDGAYLGIYLSTYQ